MIQRESAEAAALASPPSSFFMTVRDIAFWFRSARADSRLNRLRDELGVASAFDHLYTSRNDPFGADLPQYRYQRRKYDSLLSMLPRRPYRNALDIGCGLGALTRRLAPFTGHILGMDVSTEAIHQARTLSFAHPNVSYAQGDLLDDSQSGASFDLIVLADTLYYIHPLTDERLKFIVKTLAAD